MMMKAGDRMSDKPIHKKLRLQPGQTALPLNAPDGYLDLIGGSPEDVHFITSPASDVDFVHLFARDQSELDAFIEQALQSVKYDGLLWISYPKGSAKVETDLNRDIIWERLKEHGIRPVTQVSLNTTWSAMRFRPTEAVGK
jgi:hypothetical protein